ncbi:Crp/Fnr family transcriptional regulator [Halobacteriovorax sp. ZH4_bin.1]|uniref:Crp/Fnr family transcriptional regulator n=1 Tax=unclassified Halobacteriovorax TaxID=2639665 RepID=UPI003711D7DC
MEAISFLNEVMNSYHELSSDCWDELQEAFSVKSFKKGTVLVDFGDIPSKFYFVYKGLVRAYSMGQDEAAKEVNKNFFDEGRFPAAVVASLDKSSSEICIETLEDSILVEIDHAKYRQLLDKYEDLKWYHIKYLERHWVKEKEPVEISLLDGEAKERYLSFIEENPGLAKRVPLYHLASKLGITPTQLSRIRKSIN